jgi:uncharacterized protein involved in response to NO
MATIAQPAAGGAEAAAPRVKLSPAEMFEQARVREIALSRLVMAYISAGLVFMLLPGTFLGVWNLIQISGRASVAAISPAWIQAHGHAQVFGWIGSFILGIGFYSVPKLRGTAKKEVALAWACWAMWTLGVTLRWFTTAYGWEWRALLPVSALLELVAFAIFFRVVSQHRPEAAAGKRGLDPWVWVVISGAIGLFLMLAINFGASVYLALRGASPAFPHGFDQRYLTLIGWGFLVPFVWGFSAKWLPVFLGLQPTRARLLLAAVALNYAGILLTFAGQGAPATAIFVVSTLLAIAALRVFEPSRQEAKTRGVHASFPFFVRLSYGWLLVASLLGVAAARWDVSGGIWGASRHALTVGFVAVMVFCVGQRILPAFAGMRLLWSTKLMFAGLLLLVAGCTLRVSCEVLAYQGYANWAWHVLPVSAILELSGVTAFAMNLFGTFILEPSHIQKQPVIMPAPNAVS